MTAPRRRWDKLAILAGGGALPARLAEACERDVLLLLEADLPLVEDAEEARRQVESGTALLLGEAAADGRGIDLADNTESGRDGHTGKRGEGAIGFAALRGGTVAGEHSVILAGEQERITLSHSAENRAIFASGAVRGAAWLIGRDPGRYSMNDVLGL